MPTNNGMPSYSPDHVSLSLRAQVARAVENGMFVVRADVAGKQGRLGCHGSSAIVDSRGSVLATSRPLVEDLLITDIETEAPSNVLGWDASANPVVVARFLETCYPPRTVLTCLATPLSCLRRSIFPLPLDPLATEANGRSFCSFSQ